MLLTVKMYIPHRYSAYTLTATCTDTCMYRHIHTHTRSLSHVHSQSHKVANAAILTTNISKSALDALALSSAKSLIVGSSCRRRTISVKFEQARRDILIKANNYARTPTLRRTAVPVSTSKVCPSLALLCNARAQSRARKQVLFRISHRLG